MKLFTEVSTLTPTDAQVFILLAEAHKRVRAPWSDAPEPERTEFHSMLLEAQTEWDDIEGARRTLAELETQDRERALVLLASADAVFSIRETRMGIVADVGTLQRLPHIISPAHVAELAYTGADIDAARAVEIGLLNHVYEDAAAVWAAAGELAATIAPNSPLVVKGIKSVLRAGRDKSVADALDYAALWNAAFIRSNDITEAMSAFFEKRPPKYTGT